MEKTFQNSNVSARSSARLGDRASVLFAGQTSPTWVVESQFKVQADC